MEDPQKIKTTTTMWFSNFTSSNLPQGKKADTNLKRYVHINSLHHYLQYSKYASNWSVHWWMNKEGTYKQWNITQAVRNQNLDIRNNMDGPRGYHAKWSQRKTKYHNLAYL